MNPQDYGLSRPSFILDAELDCGIFAGRKDVREKLEGRIRRGLSTNTSVHTFIWGDYGSGKTHTLHYFHKYVAKQHGVDILSIFVATPQVDARSTPSDLFRGIVTAISPVEIFGLFSKVWDAHQNELQQYNDLYKRISVLQGHIQNRDLSYVIHKYIISRPSEDYAVIKWLSGERCTSKEKQSLGVISDNSDPNIAIRTLLSLFNLFSKYENKYILLLLDELETLRVLTKKKQVDFETFFRQLVSEQKGIATVMAQSVEEAGIEMSEIPIFWPRSPVGSRIGYPQNYIWLKPFEGDDQILGFVKELLHALRPANVPPDYLKNLVEQCASETEETVQEDYFPFTVEAIELMCQSLLESGSSLFPRNIENCATQCLGESMSTNKPLITTEEVSVVLSI
jgi:hypothetical protein